MFPFAGFNLYPNLIVVSPFFSGQIGAFFQYNTNYTNTFLYITPRKKVYSLNFKFYNGFGGVGIEDSLLLLSGGAYSENFWIFSALSFQGLYINGLLQYNQFFGGLIFKLSSNEGELYPNLEFIGGYTFKGFQGGLTFDTAFGIFGGYRWKFLYAFTRLKPSNSPSLDLAISILLEPEFMKKDTVRIEVPVYIQVPVIMVETLYVRREKRDIQKGSEADTSAKKDTVKADPRVVENLYLRGLDAYSKGKYAEALFFFQEVLRLDPKNKKALEAVERIRKILEGQ
ncbi:MAG: tetratricopeptide repeat protein [candidate division WOR-3 bacterium]